MYQTFAPSFCHEKPRTQLSPPSSYFPHLCHQIFVFEDPQRAKNVSQTTTTATLKLQRPVFKCLDFWRERKNVKYSNLNASNSSTN
jgi:hypothetical protein